VAHRHTRGATAAAATTAADPVDEQEPASSGQQRQGINQEEGIRIQFETLLGSSARGGNLESSIETMLDRSILTNCPDPVGTSGQIGKILMLALSLETVLASGRYVALAQASGASVREDCRDASGINFAVDRRTNCQELRAPNCPIPPTDLSASHTSHTVWIRFSFGLDPCSTEERPSLEIVTGGN
jgi:hypothetical protein